ncbi:MAG: hypothetical protein ABW212_02735 [Pseudonocardia sediminis]
MTGSPAGGRPVGSEAERDEVTGGVAWFAFCDCADGVCDCVDGFCVEDDVFGLGVDAFGTGADDGGTCDCVEEFWTDGDGICDCTHGDGVAAGTGDGDRVEGSCAAVDGVCDCAVVVTFDGDGF